MEEAATMKEGLLGASKRAGIDIVQEGSALLWTGKFCGNVKPTGPLAGKKIGIIVASEFSDFQVYYLSSYIGERGGKCEFLMIDWVTWKNTRPNVPNKGVRGMWDVSVDPMPVMMAGDKGTLYRSLRGADPKDYDGIVIVGGHSADVMVTEDEVIDFVKTLMDAGSVIGAIGEGSMPLISAGILHGKKCTGNRVVDYMLKKIGDFRSESVVTDGKLITARDTVDTPAFLSALCKVFDPTFKDLWKGAMAGKKMLLLIGEDFEDIEVIVPTLEWMHRGAEIVIGRFDPQFKSRAPNLGSNFAVGNFGSTIPFQEIPDCYYTIKQLEDVRMGDFDAAVITGAFNPWNIVATGTTEWLKEAYTAGKLIAAICHGPIPVAAADLVKGKKLAGWRASKDSVEIMGGEYDFEWAAVIDGQVVSGRLPPDLPEFLDAINVAVLG